mmetsp:Transcript_52145/g.169589  ORF Transcript_52145/g.169589 Transcript_52145/m.169589 type:complete len:229 (+) Transcript_52145:306-992(+)
MYRWWRKKTKSRWLCIVTTCRPRNCGSCGNRHASIRPSRCPRRVPKLLRMSSGRWAVGRPCPAMRLGRTSDETLKRAVGPYGSLTSQSDCGFFSLFSVKTRSEVKPRSLHASTSCLSGTAPRWRYSQFGSSVTISSIKPSSLSDGYRPVVTSVRGGTSPEKWAENSSNESSAATSSSPGWTIVSSASRVLSSVRCTCAGAASPSASASFCRSARALRWALPPSRLSLW